MSGSGAGPTSAAHEAAQQRRCAAGAHASAATRSYPDGPGPCGNGDCHQQFGDVLLANRAAADLPWRGCSGRNERRAQRVGLTRQTPARTAIRESSCAPPAQLPPGHVLLRSALVVLLLLWLAAPVALANVTRGPMSSITFGTSAPAWEYPWLPPKGERRAFTARA